MEVQTAEGHCHRAEEPTKMTCAGAWKGRELLRGSSQDLDTWLITESLDLLKVFSFYFVPFW